MAAHRKDLPPCSQLVAPLLLCLRSLCLPAESNLTALPTLQRLHRRQGTELPSARE